MHQVPSSAPTVKQHRFLKCNGLIKARPHVGMDGTFTAVGLVNFDLNFYDGPPTKPLLIDAYHRTIQNPINS